MEGRRQSKRISKKESQRECSREIELWKGTVGTGEIQVHKVGGGGIRRAAVLIQRWRLGCEEGDFMLVSTEQTAIPKSWI